MNWKLAAAILVFHFQEQVQIEHVYKHTVQTVNLSLYYCQFIAQSKLS